MSVERAGTIGVDAGCVMLGDPCYSMFKDSPNAEADHAKWMEFCEEMEAAGQYERGYCDTKYQTMVVSSGYGDGEYPVYVVKNRDGRVAAALVVFDEISDRDWDTLRYEATPDGDEECDTCGETVISCECEPCEKCGLVFCGAGDGYDGLCGNCADKAMLDE